MTNASNIAFQTRNDLAHIATTAMRERGLESEFSAAALRQLQNIHLSGHSTGHNADSHIRDCTALPWCSIDNEDSRDLDQLTACEVLDANHTRILVAIADVDVLVAKGSALDQHARTNTTSVYTSARIFPMLPERLSTDLTSLNPHQQRLAVVVDMVIAADATITQSTVYRATVYNQAKLDYDSVSAWLDGKGPLPAPAAAAPGMDQQLRVQHAVAQSLRAHRHAQGALEFESFQPRAVFDGEHVVDISQQVHNSARQLIEEFMIAANTCTAHFLAQHGGASLRRVVRSPERWAKIVTVAAQYGETLPPDPDALALETFLAKRRALDPVRFADLSLVIVKLMGSGEYVVEKPGTAAVGHFGLAVRDYTHSTAPNRRYPDLITQRMLKAILMGAPSPYGAAELNALALHCTRQEDAAKKVERRVRKSEAALVLQSRLGQHFDAVVTGVSDGAHWVRIFTPPAEGRLQSAGADVTVGQLLRVKLVHTDVLRGYIDFVPETGKL